MQSQARQLPVETPGSPNSGERADAVLTVRCIALIGFAGILSMAVSLILSRGNLILLLPIHAAMIAGLMALVMRLRRRNADVTMATLALIATAATGPIGALGAAAIAALSMGSRPSLNLLESWYERIALSIAVDPVTRFCDNVGSGRTIDLRADAPPSYEAVIAHGTTEQRQTVLGIIARRFHPDYLPVLSAALQSPEPVIRVQAAAVAAHLRPDITAMFQRSIAAIETASQSQVASLELLHRLRSLVDSGLLDESNRRQGLAVIERLGDIVLSKHASFRSTRSRFASADRSHTVDDALEHLLIERRRFADLRSLRSMRRTLMGRPHARVRRIPSQPLREEARA